MTSSIVLRYLRNDLRRNRGVAIALLVVMMLSAFLMASGAMVLERVSGSVDRMFATAKPPHFLQMHQGDFDEGALESFAAEHPEIDAWLIEEMIGFDGQAIGWQRPATGETGDLSESLIDNLFVTQNDDFDFLLETGGDGVPRPRDGEVYVPVAYELQFGIEVGDRLTVRTSGGSEGQAEQFEVVGFVRDAQMASSMSSATRFLVSDQDFERLSSGGGGTPEIIVEYRLSDTAQLSDFQQAYESDEALPKNGQAVTEVMIRLINVFSGGLTAIAFMFASLMLIAIALLNVRFVIRSTLEDEIHEIGAMRAIGLPTRTISGLYLSRYGVMALVACAAGGILAMFAVPLLTRDIQTNFAAAPTTWVSYAAPILALAVLFGLIVGICANVLRAVRRVDVVGALIHGSTVSERVTVGRARRSARRAARRVGKREHNRPSALTGVSSGKLGLRLAWLDLRAERRQWLLVPAVFFIASVLLILPTNLLTTFESPRFVTYMGAPESDLRIDVQFSTADDETGGSNSAGEARQRLLTKLESDPRIGEVVSYAGMLFEARGEEGWEALRVEVGDYSDSTLEFAQGQPPADGEIALSLLNAEEFGVVPGDTLTVRQDGEEQEARVSGVYQDITSGGYTAKMQGNVDQETIAAQAQRWVVYASLANAEDNGDDAAVVIAREYDALEPAASVIPMRHYVQQTLAYITDALRGVAVVTLAIAIGAAALIATLFLRLQVSKDRQKMGVLSALGFSLREIAAQLQLKALLTVAAGVLLGTLFAATAGEALVGSILGPSMGIARLSFIPNPWIVYLAYPLLLIGAGTVGTLILTRRLRRADRSEWLR
ncbi:ABC transporter permease [Kocuria atrinae]|uniref:FtsX-like permease family protein n=1 Tax=Kocuria atrinae TaxID=592377 RepID=A0ABN2XJK2_9MICC